MGYDSVPFRWTFYQIENTNRKKNVSQGKT